MKATFCNNKKINHLPSARSATRLVEHLRTS